MSPNSLVLAMLRKLINLLITILTVLRNVFAAIGGEAAGNNIGIFDQKPNNCVKDMQPFRI